MHEVTLDCSPPKRSFLDLPLAIRCNIFLRAGLCRKLCIELNRSVYYTKGYLSLSRSLSMPLRFVCRTNYYGITWLTYWSNAFTISRHGRGGLDGLAHLSKFALSSIRVLTIYFNNSSDRSIRPFGSLSPGYKSALKQWEIICSILSKYVKPAQLKLCIVCDCVDLDTAREFTRIASVLPPMQLCAIRLSNQPHEQLRQLARHTALGLTIQNQPVVGAFRFFDLPKEIQLQILEYTHLIATRAIELHTGNNIYPKFSRFNKLNSECLSNLTVSFPQGGITKPLDAELPAVDLCPPRVSAFNPLCSCWYFPACYFLVGREFKNLATEVFYSRNHFVIYPAKNVFVQELSHTDSGYGLGYLNHLPRDRIRHLTKLSIVLPWLEQSDLQRCQAGWECWKRGIELLSQYTNLQKLRLEICFQDAFTHSNMLPAPSLYDLKRMHKRVMSQAYASILKPLRTLPTLDGLRVYIWPPIERVRIIEFGELGVVYSAPLVIEPEDSLVDESDEALGVDSEGHPETEVESEDSDSDGLGNEEQRVRIRGDKQRHRLERRLEEWLMGKAKASGNSPTPPYYWDTSRLH